MMKPLIPLLIAVVTLSGCAGLRDSRANPANWFGRNAPPAPATDTDINPLIPERRSGLFRRDPDAVAIDLTRPVTRVTEVRADRIPGGIILRATGVDPVQGAFNVSLRPTGDGLQPENGVLSFTLRRQIPLRASTGRNDASRSITAAIRLTDQALADVRRLRVIGAENAVDVRR